jgi:hypothetical protein
MYLGRFLSHEIVRQMGRCAVQMEGILTRLAAKPPFRFFNAAEGNRRTAICAFGHCFSGPAGCRDIL